MMGGMTEHNPITVNGNPADAGCYVEGHWGQYGPDHLADQAERFGWTPDPTERPDPRSWRAAAESDAIDAPDMEADSWERHVEAGETLIDWLNDHTVGASWGWFEGEVYLWTDDQWAETGY